MSGETERRGKRRLRVFSASEKLEAIVRVNKGESKASVGRDLGAPESTLRGWCKSEDKIRGLTRKSSTPAFPAHSPASSMAATMAAAGSSNSSEGEGPPAKRPRTYRSIRPGASDTKQMDAEAPTTPVPTPQQFNSVEQCYNEDEDVLVSKKEAIAHGEELFKWLDACSDPAVSRHQILQFDHLLYNLKSSRQKAQARSKQSRKTNVGED